MAIEKMKTNMARRLRDNQTEAERIIWNQLRAKRLDGLKFRRQQPIGKYITDFVCLDKKLIVELDGGQHNEPGADVDRDDWLKDKGFKIVRVWNNEVFQNIDGVMETIREASATLP